MSDESTEAGTQASPAEDHANDGYVSGASAATLDQQVPPAVFPDELDKVQSAEQSGTPREGDGSGAERTEQDPAADGKITGAYADENVADLQGEVDRRVAEGRTIEVTGTGANGGVVKDDLVRALEADDAAAAA